MIQVEHRDRVRELLRAQGVATAIHYPIRISRRLVRIWVIRVGPFL